MVPWSFVFWYNCVGYDGGVVHVWFIVLESFFVASMNCNVWSSCMVVLSMCVCALNSFIDLFPRSMLRIGHLPQL